MMGVKEPELLTSGSPLVFFRRWEQKQETDKETAKIAGGKLMAVPERWLNNDNDQC